MPSKFTSINGYIKSGFIRGGYNATYINKDKHKTDIKI